VADRLDIHRLVVEHALDLVSVVHADGRVVYASPSHERVLGHAPEALAGTDWMELVHPDDREPAQAAMDADREIAPVVRLRHRDGRWILVEGQATAIPDAGLLLAVWRDVTARTRAERRRDAQYTVTRVLAAAQQLPEAAAGVLRVVGERLGWELGQLWRLEGSKLRRVALWRDDALPPGDADPLTRESELGPGERLPGRVLRDGAPDWTPDILTDRDAPGEGALHAGIAVPVVARGSTWGVLEFAGRKQRVPDDDRLRVFASIGGQLGLFIERSDAEQAAGASRTMLAAIVEGTLDAVFVKDRAGRYMLINDAGAQAFGREIEDIIGLDDTELLDAEAAADLMARDREVMDGGETIVSEESLGSRVFLSTKVPYRDEQGELQGLIGIAHDITERRRLEAELQQAQKMEAVGRLAGGVAHDFNNILSVVRGFSDLARARLDGSEAAVDEWLQQVAHATDQGTALTRQLLAFSRRQPLETEVLEVNGVVAELDPLLRRALGEDLRLVTVFGASPGTVELNRSQLEQVVMNLAVNARDAMPTGGKLTIETAEVALDEDAAARLGLAPGRYVTLRFSDTGVGMDADTRSRIFEPFFTTKEAGRGTGLGLSTVYGIVTQSGGHIAVESAAGAGSMFTIHLPCARAAARRRARGDDERPSVAPSGTLLLAEDDDTLRGLIRAMLEQGGYSVLAARTGEEALEVAAAFGGEIDALVTDVIMPGMRGPELATRLRVQRPGLRVVFVTGYADEPVERELRPGDALLTKPLAMSRLLGALGRVLPAAGARQNAG
jgi:two-component system, cell cycle sensor histidine kinase and response regulator CckA